MMRALLLVALLLAGCAAPAATLPQSAPQPRSLLAAPQLAEGEWWRYHLGDLTGAQLEFTRVVARAGPDAYLVGVLEGEDEALDTTLVDHVPGVGEVSRANLSYLVHGIPSGFVRFPLAEGDTWSVVFEGASGVASVESVEGSVARIRYQGPFGVEGNATYDADVGALTELDLVGYAHLRVVAHGFGETRRVVAPVGAQLVVFARIAGAATAGLQPAPPTDAWSPPPGTQRVTYSVFVLDVGAPASAGACRERATPPGQPTREVQRLPTETGNRFFTSHVDDAGAWSFEHVAAGTCAVGTELVSYRLARGAPGASFS